MRHDELVYKTNIDEKETRLGIIFIKVFTILLLIINGYIIYAVPKLFKSGGKFETYVPALIERTVKIEVESKYGEWEGSGVFVKDDLILTAGHIVDEAAFIVVTFPDGSQYDAISWYKEDAADLGFIEVKTPRKEITASFGEPDVGESVWVIGNPFGTYPVVSKGIISAVNMPDSYSNRKRMIIIDAAVNPGNSGGPAYSEFGTILGICSWGYANSQGMSYFERAEVCRLALEKYLAMKALEKVK